MNTRPIFEGRTTAGETLYDALGWPFAPAVYAISLGGLEVACPVAYLGRGALGTVVGPPASGPEATRGASLLVDDGCTPAAELLAAIDELRGRGVEGLVVASPWLDREIRAAARARGIRAVSLLSARTRPLRLYPPHDRPSARRVARFLEAPAVLPALSSGRPGGRSTLAGAR